jgi:hypothetical protein
MIVRHSTLYIPSVCSTYLQRPVSLQDTEWKAYSSFPFCFRSPLIFPTAFRNSP